MSRVRVNSSCEMLSIVSRYEPRYGDLRKVGIPKVAGSVGIGSFHGLCHQMNGLGGMGPVVSDGKILQNIEHLDEMDAPRAWGRHG